MGRLEAAVPAGFADPHEASLRQCRLIPVVIGNNSRLFVSPQIIGRYLVPVPAMGRPAITPAGLGIEDC